MPGLAPPLKWQIYRSHERFFHPTAGFSRFPLDTVAGKLPPVISTREWIVLNVFRRIYAFYAVV